MPRRCGWARSTIQEHNLHFVRRIEEQADRLHELILDILQIARVESGQQSFEMADVPVADLIDAMRATNLPSWRPPSKSSLQPSAPPAAMSRHADDEGVRTILNNLVDNAIKYTPAGGRVVIRAVPDSR